MNSKRSAYSAANRITRREFMVAAITTVGGIALFSLPKNAYALENDTIYDSLGNVIDLTKPIGRVVPAGIYAQTLMETLFPEALVSVAKEVSSDSVDFEEAGLDRVTRLPETGTPKGNFGKNISYERIKALSPDLVLQAGFDPKKGDSETSLITEETDTQTMYLDIGFGKLPEAYRTLGQALGYSERAEAIASYIESAQERAVKSANVGDNRICVFYAPRVAGKKVTSGLCIQVDALEALGYEAITSPYDFTNKTVNFAELEKENPHFILFDDTNFPSEFFKSEGEVYEDWRNVSAICEGRFAIAPALIHSILGSAIFAQSIGMLWMAYVLEGKDSTLDIASEMQDFYRVLYNLEQGKDEVRNLLGISD